MTSNKDKVCGSCAFWIKEGTPYCTMKDLYTHTDKEQPCDEYDINGELLYCKEVLPC